MAANYILEGSSSARRRSSGKGWMVAVIAVILLVILVFWMLRSKRTDSTTDEPEPPVAPAATGQAAAPASKSTAASADLEPHSATTLDQPLTTAAAPSGNALLRKALADRERGDLVAARDSTLALLKATTDHAMKMRAEELLGSINIDLVLTPRDMPEKEDYTVQSGDSLAKIAKKFGTTVEMIQKGNNVKGSLIRAGDRMRIFTGSFSIEVDKSDNDLLLKMNDRFFKRYRVGTGEYNRTPVGDFTITDRIAQPTWWRPDGKEIPYGDPENLLGTHWLAINIRGYGIHGTWEPDTIGKQLSAGCVRMLNDDVEELFTLITLGTPVTITD